MLLYRLLHLTGYDLTLADLQAFRQWESRTPGHPETLLTPGRRGHDGTARAGHAPTRVGMAMAERASRIASTVRATRSSTIGPTRSCRTAISMEGHFGGSRVARRPSEARQADLPLRLQPHLARRTDLARVLDRGRRRALRRVRLAGVEGRERRHGSRRDRSLRITEAGGRHDAALDHRRADDDRLRRAQEAGHLGGAREPARTG